MKISSRTLITVALASLMLQNCFEAKLQGGRGNQRSLEAAPQAIDCTIFKIDIFNPNGEQEESIYRCVLDNDNDENDAPAVDYDIEGLQSDFFDNHPVISGLTGLSVSHAFKTKANESNNNNGPNTVRIVPGAAISTYMKNKNNNKNDRQRNLRSGNENNKDHQRRELWMLEGDPTLVVVRVTDTTGSGPNQSPSQLSDDVFGTVNGPPTMKSQFEACSKDKLRFQMGTDGATGSSTITNGVMEIQVPYNLNGVERFTAMDYAVAETQRVLGGTLYNSFDHIMYVMPEYVDFGTAAAFAYVGWYRSVFKNQAASNLQTQMHELGHNLKMLHSGEGSSEYGDGTGRMGGLGRTNQCFNPAKSWYTGWYNDAHVTIDPTISSWSGELVGADDYVNNNIDLSNHNVVAKIGNDLYMMYNRKKGINRDVYEYGNQVTIVQQAMEDRSVSWLQAHLGAGQEYRVARWNGQSYDLVIKVCSQSPITSDTTTTDTAATLVFLDDGVNTLYCPVVTAAPSTSSTPTVSPITPAPATPAPTPTPTACQVETNVPGTCLESADCCIGMSCTKGKAANRYCYLNGGGGDGSDGGGGGGDTTTCSVSNCKSLPCCDGLTCNSKNKKCS